MDEKPVSVVINEFKMNLAKCVSDASLPPYIIEPILKDMYEEVRTLSYQQYLQDQKEYEEKQRNQETVEG